jgi:hypothetical protein
MLVFYSEMSASGRRAVGFCEIASAELVDVIGRKCDIKRSWHSREWGNFKKFHACPIIAVQGITIG